MPCPKLILIIRVLISQCSIQLAMFGVKLMYCDVGNTFSYLQNTADHSRHCGSNCNRQFLLRVFGGDIPLCVFRIWIDFDACRRFHDCHYRNHYNSEVGLNIEINYLVGCSV